MAPFFAPIFRPNIVKSFSHPVHPVLEKGSVKPVLIPDGMDL
jgi:hypothetical protein